MRFITKGTVRAAAALVRTGEVIPLNARLDSDKPPAGRPRLRRAARMHNTLRPLGEERFLVINDDVVEFALQGSSHIDAFAHMGLLEPGSDAVYYGGAGLDDTAVEPRSKTRGIEMLGGAIVTRGVLVDLVAGLGPHEPYLSDGTNVGIAGVRACLERERVELRRGDAVVFFTGYEERVRRLGGEGPAKVAGIDGTTLELWRDAQVSLLAADNLTVEAYPVDYAIHLGALRGLGIPLGEMWALERLVAACRGDGVYEFLLVSVPLNLPGAFGSPANAVAIR